MRERRGQYYDALFNKRNLVVAFVIEGGAGAGGGITPRARAYMRHVARTATCAGATDRTAYGVARGSTRDFLTHHTRRIVKAAVIGGAYVLDLRADHQPQTARVRARGGGGVEGLLPCDTMRVRP